MFVIIHATQFCREKNYVRDFFTLSPIDGRFIVNWFCFAKAVLLDATGDDEKWAKIILRVCMESCYDINIYAEWHHLVPLCMRGSVHDPSNYVRIQPGLHLLVHAALSYFFPSYSKLQFAVHCMLNGNHDHTMKKLHGKELANFLQDAEAKEEDYATARIEAAKQSKKSKKPPSREKDDNVVNAVDVDVPPSVVEVKKKKPRTTKL